MSRGVALVTGAGTGIGRSVAVALARADYAMVLAGRRKAQLEQTAVEAGGATLALVADVTQPGSVEALFAEIKSRFGRLDLLFNNAGIATAPVGIDELSVEDWRATIDTNLTGTFLCTRAAFRLMKSQQPPGGRIINNGSLSATTPRPEMVAYTASKHGVSGVTKATALKDGSTTSHAARSISVTRELRSAHPFSKVRSRRMVRAPPSRPWTSRTSPMPSFIWPDYRSMRMCCS